MNSYELKASYSSSRNYKFVEIVMDEVIDSQRISEAISRITENFLMSYKYKAYRNKNGDNSIVIKKKRNMFFRSKGIISTDILNNTDCNTINLTLNPCSDRLEKDLEILIEKLMEEL